MALNWELKLFEITLACGRGGQREGFRGSNNLSPSIPMYTYAYTSLKGSHVRA